MIERLTNKKIILSTNRLILCEMSENDLGHLQQIFDEAISMTFYTLEQKSEKANIWIDHMLDSYKKNGFGMWLCFEEESQKFVGQCGLMKNEIDRNEEMELGYSVLRKYWNRGYATEAAQACIHYAFENLNTEQVVSLIDKENQPSIQVSKKIGMVRIKQVERGIKMADLYSINKTIL